MNKDSVTIPLRRYLEYQTQCPVAGGRIRELIATVKQVWNERKIRNGNPAGYEPSVRGLGRLDIPDE